MTVRTERATPAPVFHNTRSPLGCCPRCHKAELAGRARHRPVFRYDKVEVDEESSCYRLFHGAEQVATLTREHRSRALFYEVIVAWDSGPLAAGNLREARRLAEEAYTAVWLEGRYAVRGPVKTL